MVSHPAENFCHIAAGWDMFIIKSFFLQGSYSSFGCQACIRSGASESRILLRMLFDSLTQDFSSLRLFFSQRIRPFLADCNPGQMIPVRFSPIPVSTIFLLHPNTVSARRMLPLQYLIVISAIYERHSYPCIFETARRISSI